MAVLGWFTAAAFLAAWDLVWVSVPLTPPHAARPVAVNAADVPRNVRRELRRSGIGLLGDDEGVVRVPGELHLAAHRERLRLRAVGVLREDGELLAAGGPDDVLDRDAEERRHDHPAAEH